MGLKKAKVTLLQIAQDKYLRNDEKFCDFASRDGWNVFGSDGELVMLADVLERDYHVFEFGEGEYKGIPTGQSYIDSDGEIVDWQVVSKDDHPSRLKYKVTDENILISSLRLARSPALMFEDIDLSDMVFSNGFYIFKVKEDWNKKFVLYMLRNKRVKKILDESIYRGIGIAAYKEDDLLKLKVPKVAEEGQKKAVAEIEKIEAEIGAIKASLVKANEVINEIFAKRYGFPAGIYDEIGKGLTAGTLEAKPRSLREFEVNLSDVAKSDALRFSVRFHDLPIKKMMDTMKAMDTLRLEKVVSSVERGVQPQYDSEGEIAVIKIANLKNEFIDYENTEKVAREHYDVLDDAKKLKKGDVLVCSTGSSSLGKVDMVDEDTEAITAVDNMIIRVDKTKCLPEYLVFVLRSIMGVYQMERDYTGATNQIHIYWEQLKDFEIPDLGIKEQSEVVEEIKGLLDENMKKRREIEAKRRYIDEVIERNLIK